MGRDKAEEMLQPYGEDDSPSRGSRRSEVTLRTDVDARGPEIGRPPRAQTPADPESSGPAGLVTGLRREEDVSSFTRTTS